jgi:hypothetical protein
MKKVASQQTDQQIDQVKLIYDYAKFHIGLYATVNTALVAVLSFADKNFKEHYRGLFLIIFLCFLAAGIGGGLVASHIVYSQWDAQNVGKLLKGFFQPTLSSPFKWTKFKWFIFLEHYAFWLGILVGLIGVAYVYWLSGI